MARDITRDVVRGLTVLEMETVNNSDWWLLGHADVNAHKITYADTVFPNFVFLSGMSPVSWKRGVSLVGLGLAYNGLGVLKSGRDYQPRYVGVLQRSGLAMAITGLLPSMCPRYQLALLGLWTAGTVLLAKNPKEPFATPQDTAQTKIDTAVFGSNSLYRPEYDPEGLLGALTTAVTAWLGYYYMHFYPEAGVKESLQLGGGLIAIGSALAITLPRFFPVSKPFWTPSFTFIAGGYSVLKYAAVSAALPYLPGPVKYVLTCLGRRTTEVFFSSAILQQVQRRWNLWDRAKTWLAQYIGVRGADLTLVMLNNALMAFLAVQYVKHGIRIKL
ncbi:hypothetical protein TRVA0_085S00166 [Trichomonascus vanleenenianus]|uniref:uncharacterized protein n=1 Tax=Trichomonascus vanleenenianus TaxID=2268995 RepID=UPI003ECA99A6